MKATLVLLLAAAGFAGFLLWTHGSADDLVAREDAARARLAEKGPLPAAAGGYRFETIPAQEGLAALRVAAPEEHMKTGVRWFVTADGEAIYAFDPVQRAVRDHRPDLAPIRRYLAQPSDRPPVGWVRVP